MDITALGGGDQQLFQTLLLLSLLTFPFKGLALWKSANLKRRGWFIVLLIFNTFGILDIIYYFFLDTGKPKKPAKQ